MPLPRDAILADDPERRFSEPAPDDGAGGAFLKPIIAGARARGVADAFEMLGVGAVLIDATGRVLHAGGRARRMIGGHARIVGDHLLAERAADNAAFQTLVGSAIGLGTHDPDSRIVFVDLAGSHRLEMRALRFPSDEGDAQRLRAVLVLDEASTGRTAEKAPARRIFLSDRRHEEVDASGRGG